jgi:hypothetical protein
MSNAKPGIGAILRRWDTSATVGVWQEVVEVTAIGWGGASRQVIETFKLNSTTDFVNKFQGILNGGQISFTINYTFAQYVQLKTDMETRGNIQYQLELPDGEALEWDGFIVELPLDIGSGDVMQGEVVIEIDGQPDLVTTPT